MRRFDLIVVGAGPSGLSAAIEAAKRGMDVVVFDENEKPGGQLFKQIHKFFGSKEHKAKIRGFKNGEDLLKEADAEGVKVMLNATVCGMYQDKEITVRIHDEIHHFKGDSILIATGASENMVTFPGWTLPGVIGAGAAQTMMNLHGVKPGSRVLMLGSGNVGLVVSFQLMQCGCGSKSWWIRSACSKGSAYRSSILSFTHHCKGRGRYSRNRSYYRRSGFFLSIYRRNRETL